MNIYKCGDNLIIPFELHKEVIEVLGDYEVIRNHRKGSKRTVVWEIQSLNYNKRYFVKVFYRKSRWGPEVFAYENWTPKILPFAPQLISVIEKNNIYAIIISSLGGVTLREAKGLSEEQIQKAYQKAGEITRTLHQNTYGSYFGRPDNEGNPIEIYHSNDPVDYMQHSIIDALDKGKEINCFDSRELSLAKWALDNISSFESFIPRAVCWDSSPNNWLVDEHSGDFIGLIDFENMLWGLEVDNFTILYERYFPDFPKGEDAYFNGYGSKVKDNWSTQIDIALIKAGLCGMVWGLINDDERSVVLARRMLSKIEK